MPWKNSHEMSSPSQSDETEQAHHIDDGQPADAFFHELAEVRHHARW